MARNAATKKEMFISVWALHGIFYFVNVLLALLVTYLFMSVFIDRVFLNLPYNDLNA